MNKIVYFSIIFFVLALVGFVSSATDTNSVDDIFKINTFVNYSKPCLNNGSYCSAAAVCNYTFIRPDNSIQIKNVQATNNGDVHIYRLSFDTNGIYTINMVCNDNGLTGAETYHAQINGSGMNSNIAFLVIYLLIAVGIIVLAFAVGEPWFAVFGSLLLIPAGIYIINNGIGDVKDMTTTWGIGIVVIGIATVIGIKSALEVIGDD